MTKRILALVLVCILAIPIFAVPASATGYYTGEYDYGIYQYLIRLTDVFIKSIDNTLDSIDGWCDTLWQEIRNSSTWMQITLWSALDTINSNLIALDNNVTLWLEGILTSLIDLFDGIYQHLDGWVEVFFSWWDAFEIWMTDLWTEINTFRLDAVYYLQSLLFGSPEEEQASDQFEDQASTEVTEFEENMDILDEWTKPDYESDFDPSVDAITDGENIADYTDMLGAVIAEFTPVLFMSFAFSLIAFVVFGKR